MTWCVGESERSDHSLTTSHLLCKKPSGPLCVRLTVSFKKECSFFREAPVLQKGFWSCFWSQHVVLRPPAQNPRHLKWQCCGFESNCVCCCLICSMVQKQNKHGEKKGPALCFYITLIDFHNALCVCFYFLLLWHLSLSLHVRSLFCNTSLLVVFVSLLLYRLLGFFLQTLSPDLLFYDFMLMARHYILSVITFSVLSLRFIPSIISVLSCYFPSLSSVQF